MAARNVKRREKLTAPEPPLTPVDATDTQLIYEWVPDYTRAGEVCGETPCVTGVYHGKVVYQGGMCGVCTWGEAACLDPANW